MTRYGVLSTRLLGEAKEADVRWCGPWTRVTYDPFGGRRRRPHPHKLRLRTNEAEPLPWGEAEVAVELRESPMPAGVYAAVDKSSQ